MFEDIVARIDELLEPAGASPRLLHLYREIGLAAVACEFNLDLDEDGASLSPPSAVGKGELAA